MNKQGLESAPASTSKARKGRRYRVGLVYLGLTWVGSVPSHRLRRLLYRRVFRVNLDPSASIHARATIRGPKGITIGAHSIIGDNATLDGLGGLTIGQSVNLSSEVAIWTMQHDLSDSQFVGRKQAVSIGDRAWVSFRTTILPGVQIGEGAVVAAGAVVAKDVAPYTVVGGIPARVIGTRPRDLAYTLGPPDPFL